MLWVVRKPNEEKSYSEEESQFAQFEIIIWLLISTNNTMVVFFKEGTNCPSWQKVTVAQIKKKKGRGS